MAKWPFCFECDSRAVRSLVVLNSLTALAEWRNNAFVGGYVGSFLSSTMLSMVGAQGQSAKLRDEINFCMTVLNLAAHLVATARAGTEGRSTISREDARKAYDFALKFLANSHLTKRQEAVIAKRLAGLKADLQALGETF